MASDDSNDIRSPFWTDPESLNPNSPEYLAALDAVFNLPAEELEKLAAKWARKAFWTVDESTALLMATVPESVTQGLYRRLPVEKAEQFTILQDDIQRQFGAQVVPTELLVWADKLNVEVPEQLRVALHRLRDGGPPKTRKSDEARITNTLLKMILAMAVDKYGYDPDKTNSATKMIEGASEKIGARVSQSTIRECLSKAKELDDIDWNVVRENKR